MGPIWDAELRVWDAKNFGLVSPGTHRNKFVKKSLTLIRLLQREQSNQGPYWLQLERKQMKEQTTKVETGRLWVKMMIIF